jgi:hypothetical protein
MRKFFIGALACLFAMMSTVAAAGEYVPYVGVGGLLTKLESDDGSFSDYAVGYKVLGGLMWLSEQGDGFGAEVQYSDSLDAESGNVDVSVDGFTVYGTWTAKPWVYWDASAKIGMTFQDASASPGFGSRSDDGLAVAAIVRRWVGNVGVGIGAEWYNTNFSGALKEPWRAELTVEYRF